MQRFSFLSRLRQGRRTLFGRVAALALTGWFSVPALADLPSVEAPSTGTGNGLMDTLKGYVYDGFTILGLIVATVSFLYVAQAAIHTFAEVRDGRANWGKFGGIIVVGIVLIVAVIWLCTKAADILA